MSQARAAFGGDGGEMPTVTVGQGVNNIIDIMLAAKVCKSKSEARQLITGGGVKIDDEKVSAFDYCVDDARLASGVVLHKGKKSHTRIVRG